MKHYIKCVVALFEKLLDSRTSGEKVGLCNGSLPRGIAGSSAHARSSDLCTRLYA